MKLGILTFHSAHNYGAVLQAYGLQEYLKQHGHDVYVIDYRPDYITRCYPKDGSVFGRMPIFWNAFGVYITIMSTLLFVIIDGTILSIL